MGRMSRRMVQITTAIGINSYYTGFLQGTVYSGSMKNICLPVLNCSSCPGAWGACPLAIIQVGMAGTPKYTAAYLTLGILPLLGLTFGRFICGWMCPFGLLQEMLYKVPSPKVFLKGKLLLLENVKYAILGFFVLLLPAWNFFGTGSTAFCRYICPVEILEARMPIILARPFVLLNFGALFTVKLVFLIGLLVLAIVLCKPFCRFLCPLGAIYSLANSISLFRYKVDSSKCIECGKCQEECPMKIPVFQKPNHRECMRCSDCLNCPTDALSVQSITCKTDQERVYYGGE